VWIGVKLLMPEHDEGHTKIEGSDKLWGAVKTVIVADFVMSVDNVIAIAGAAETAGGGQHSMALVIFGVLVSIPIIVWGSQLVIKLMDRFPVIITAGGMLLGWIAGMIVTDPALARPRPTSGRQLPGHRTPTGGLTRPSDRRSGAGRRLRSDHHGHPRPRQRQRRAFGLGGPGGLGKHPAAGDADQVAETTAASLSARHTDSR
jgi:hypothetical protein